MYIINLCLMISNFLINNFFKNWKPDIATFVDSEIWPNFIFKIKRKNIPLILIKCTN